jgi:peptidoglycan/LPS O-acetylase OafA/YrhL
MESILDFLQGAITAGYLVCGVFFLRFWRRTAERLFLAFSVAFAFLAMNQVLAWFLEAGDERTAYVYSLRVIGFVLILAAIVDKNVSRKSSRGS